MDQLLALFEKSLAEYQASIDKKDNLVGTGEILLQEFRKQRDQIITLGQLLADFYGSQPAGHKVMIGDSSERAHIAEIRSCLRERN